MPIQLHDVSLQVRVPDEDVEFETAADDDFVLLTVGHLAHCPHMTDQCLDRRHSHVTVDLFIHGLVLEVVLNLVLHLLLKSLLLGTHVTSLSLVVTLVLHLLLAQIPEMDLAVVVTSS